MTVLFADIVGFTSLSEHLDPEQVKHLVDRCFRWLTAEIVSFGGRVDKIIGDAIVALFGAPVAHEDDPERAVRVALRMQQIIEERSDELESAVRLRIGVNTGEVLVGALAAGGDYTAMGDVVNTANRLQSAAGPGEILVGATTFAATRRVIPYNDRGVVPAKGRAEPVHAWEPRAPRTVPGTRPGRTGGPLIGRDDEVTALHRVAATALTHERAALLVVLGDAGIGKSRIASELNALLHRDRDVTVLQGRCVPYGEVNPWWPIADALRGLAGIDITDPVEVVEARLAALVTETADPERTARENARIVDGLLRLFGFGGSSDRDGTNDPERFRAMVAEGFVTFVDDLTRRGAVVLWLSDLHWADPVVQDLIESTLAALARRPIVALATARRSLLDSWSPPVGRFDTFALNLEALDPGAIDGLIDALVGDVDIGTMSEATRSELRLRSGGNPLFLIELLALLDEQRVAATMGATPGVLPDTLRGLVAARLDNLSPDERAVLDDASVLGRRGRIENLSEMARQIRGSGDIEASLMALADRDLLRVEGDRWEFASDVTREVAYGMLTKSERAKRHLGVAQWVESTRPGPATEGHADLLAYHYGRAAELLDDLGTIDRLPGPVRAQALHWIDEVSARDERMRLLPAVELLTTQGLALAGDDIAEMRLTLLLRRAAGRINAREVTGAVEDVSVATVLAKDLGDGAALARAQLVEGEIARQRGHLDDARATFAAAVEGFADVGDVEGRAEALRALGMAELFAGRRAEAERTMSAALDAFRSLGRRSGEAWALQNLGWIAFAQGRIDEASRRIEESADLFEAMGNTGGTAWAHGLEGFIRLAEGDLAGADALQRRVLADAEVGGDRWATAMMLLLGAIVRLWTGRTEEGVNLATEGLDLFRAVHDRYGQIRVAWPLARGLAMRGSADAAWGALDAVDASVAGDGGEGVAMEDGLVLGVARASVAVHLGQPESALSTLAGLSEILGRQEIAVLLGAVDGDVDVESCVTVGLQAGAGIDLFTVIATSLAQMGRTADASALLEMTARLLDVGAERAALNATLALVLAAEGRADEARTAAWTVLDDGHASYLDRAFAAIGLGLAAGRLGDMDAVGRAFAAAGAALSATGDRLTKALVGLAESRTFDALAVGVPADRVSTDRASEALARLVDMGTDAHGWTALFDLALGRDAPGR